jgi:hypothetical protein
MYRDFFKFNPPFWVRRILFIIDVKSKTIGIGTIGFQILINLLTLIYFLHIIRLDIFYYAIGVNMDYRALFMLFFFFVAIPNVVYTCICEIVIKRREKRKQK